MKDPARELPCFETSDPGHAFKQYFSGYPDCSKLDKHREILKMSELIDVR